jgi:hypothetical protein
MLAGVLAAAAGRARRLAQLALLALPAALPPPGPAAAQTAPGAAPGAPSVAFEPAPDSTDYADLFLHPDRWATTRRSVNIFVISPSILKHGSTGNTLDQAIAIGEFGKLQQWGLETEIAVGALKEWDCAARTTPGRTLANIADIHRNGGAVQIVSMDEPLLAAIRTATVNGLACHLPIPVAAQEIAAFAQAVTAGVAAQKLGPAPQFVDIESYPGVPLEAHEAYIAALLADGFQPAGYRLDISLPQIARRPGAQQRFPGDMQALAAFLQARQIPLGLIVWSSGDPEPSDQSYVTDALAFTRTMHGILGQPPVVMFSSWVHRCAPGSNLAECPRNVPQNLPEAGPASHTKLIHDALAILAQP